MKNTLTLLTPNFLKEYESIARALVISLAGKSQDAMYSTEDLIQEAMISLYLCADSYDVTKGASFKTYSTKCMKNRIFELLRQKAKQPEFVEFTDEYECIDESSIKAFENVEDDMIILSVLDYIENNLSNKVTGASPSEIFDLLLCGDTIAAIAKKTGVKTTTIKAFISRARKTFSQEEGFLELKKQLKEQFL